MLRFIVLGQIPGTSIQINFGLYLLAISLLGIVVSMLYYSTHKQQLRRMRQLSKESVDQTAL